MPLSMSQTGESETVQRITGNTETRRYLENLGFLAGTPVEVVSSIGGNVIVSIRDSRIAVNEDMARHIYV